MARGGFAMFGTQRFEQLGQTVMVDLLHQCKQSAEFAVRETFTGEPVQVRAWQVGDDPALVLAEGHFTGDQQFEFFRIHQGQSSGFGTLWKIQAFCMQAK